MSYVDDTLLPGETVLYRGKVHWIVFMPPILFSGVALLVAMYLNQLVISGCLLFVALWMYGQAIIYYFATELAVTDQRVISKFGFILRVTFELSLDRVMGLNVNQTIAGRIFNYGNLLINGIGGIATPIPLVSDPLTFRHWVLGEVKEKE